MFLGFYICRLLVRKIILHARIIVIFIALVLLCCKASESKKVVRLAHALDTNHPVHQAMVFMADRVKKESRGRITIRIYPNGQLGSERELVELLQIGILDITKVSVATLENFVPEVKVFSLPYLFRDHDHYWRVLKSDIGKEILLRGEPFWIRGLGYYDAGSRSFYSKKHPISKPNDFVGLKVRVMKSPTFVETISAMGGSPTPITWGELYTALQQGVVDVAENNPPSFFYSRHFEVCKYYSLDEHASPPDIVLISTHCWKNLEKNEQEILLEAINESVEFQIDKWRQTENEVLQELREAGVQITYPNKNLFIEAVAPIYKAYADSYLWPLIHRIQSYP